MPSTCRAAAHSTLLPTRLRSLYDATQHEPEYLAEPADAPLGPYSNRTGDEWARRGPSTESGPPGSLSSKIPGEQDRRVLDAGYEPCAGVAEGGDLAQRPVAGQAANVRDERRQVPAGAACVEDQEPRYSRVEEGQSHILPIW